MTTEPIPGKTTARKFWVALLFAALIGALQIVANALNAAPAYSAWGTALLAVTGALSVYAVPNKLIVSNG